MNDPVGPIRLPKLPQRTPIKLTIALPPDLHTRLSEYTKLYRATYGEEERLTELIPYMLKTFIDGDRAFTRLGRIQRGATGASGGEE